jgi:hypothetical protein
VQHSQQTGSGLQTYITTTRKPLGELYMWAGGWLLGWGLQVPARQVISGNFHCGCLFIPSCLSSDATPWHSAGIVSSAASGISDVHPVASRATRCCQAVAQTDRLALSSLLSIRAHKQLLPPTSPWSEPGGQSCSPLTFSTMRALAYSSGMYSSGSPIMVRHWIICPGPPFLAVLVKMLRFVAECWRAAGPVQALAGRYSTRLGSVSSGTTPKQPCKLPGEHLQQHASFRSLGGCHAEG